MSPSGLRVCFLCDGSPALPSVFDSIDLSAFIASYLIFDGDMKAVVAASVSAFIGVSLYSTAFIWMGLMTTKAIGFGLLYVFLE